jgi:hypothetical protein
MLITFVLPPAARCYVAGVNLVDCVAQCHAPFVVRQGASGDLAVLNNTADYAPVVTRCPLRYVLTDELTRLCAELAYSRGARALACADLLHVPAETLWVEWCNEPWKRALQQYGFPSTGSGSVSVGRRGALIRSSPEGRRGLVRTFWNVEAEALASSIEAYFDFDTPDGEDPEPPERVPQSAANAGKVHDDARAGDDLLARCFRFRYERSWSDYYQRAALSSDQSHALWRHALGTIAMDIPLLLAFFLLLAARSGLPQQPVALARLNRQRRHSGKPPLLDHIEVRAPVLPDYRDGHREESQGARRSPRLHHVRGHLVRRGSQLFWRVPHLRGRARSGLLQSRTVVWTFDDAPARQRVQQALATAAGMSPASAPAPRPN